MNEYNRGPWLSRNKGNVLFIVKLLLTFGMLWGSAFIISIIPKDAWYAFPAMLTLGTVFLISVLFTVKQGIENWD